jgi:SPP1 family predicted phage head-tail adaptor
MNLDKKSILNPGRLPHQVTFLVPQAGKDATGGPLPLVAGATTWASVVFVSGKNQFGGQTWVAEATHRISMRYRLGVFGNWQVQFQGTNFEILYLDNVQQAGVRLDVYCKVIDGSS